MDGSTVRQAHRTQLRKLLSVHLDVEELRTACFDLSIDYDSLRGEGKANKARELILWLERRHRTDELLSWGNRERPDVSWPPLPDQAPAPPQYSRPVSRGLSALAELMRDSQVRAAVEAFQADFRAACEHIEILGDYKLLHDRLHSLQFHCFSPLEQEVPRFPDDDIALDHIMDYELTLQQIVGELQGIAKRASFPETEIEWIGALVETQDTLALALEKRDPELLKKVLWKLNRVLTDHPSRINTRLNTAARMLRLPDLVEAMTYVSDRLAELALDPAKVEQFEAGLDALVSLSHSLTRTVDDHEAWQIVDLALRRIASSMRWDLMELKMSWPDVKAGVERLCEASPEVWATRLLQESADLDQAIVRQNPVQVQRAFRRYRRRVGNRFHQVDIDLKRLCEELRPVGKPLVSVIERIE